MSETYIPAGPVKGKSCANCKHLREARLFTTCDAFPDGIPGMFINNDEFHGKPFPGDHGIHWEPVHDPKLDGLFTDDAS